MHKHLFGVDAKKVGSDTGYAGAENRNYCKENNIQTSFVKRGRPSVQRREEGERPCQKRAGQSESDRDGRIIRNTERTLRLEKSQGQDGTYGDLVHLLRHPHCKRDATDRRQKRKVQQVVAKR